LKRTVIRYNMKEETFDLFGSPWRIIYCDKIEIEGEDPDEDKF